VAGDDQIDSGTTFTKEQVDALIEEKIAGLKANRDDVLREAKAAKERLRALEGVDPEEHKRLKAAAEEAEKKKLAAEGDWKAMEKQLVDKYEAQLVAERTEKSGILSSMEQYLIDSAAVAELARHSDSPRLLLPHVKSVMKVVREDGQYSARVIDPVTGMVRIGKGAGSTPMTLGELIEEMKGNAEYAPAFRGTGSSGSGAAKSNAGGGGAKVIAAGDNNAFLANLEGIANGSVRVQA